MLRNDEEVGGGGGGALLGPLNGELGLRVPGIGGGRPGAGAGGGSFALFAAAVTRRLFILDVCRTARFSDTLRGIGGAFPAGRLVAEVVPGGGGATRPIGGGAGGLLPTMVAGRFGDSTKLVRGRGTGADSTLIVDVGRSARDKLASDLRYETKIPPVFTPPFVARSFGIPPANNPPKPGGPPPPNGGAGADNAGASASPALFALALVVGTGGRNPVLGTGGVLPTGAALTALVFAIISPD